MANLSKFENFQRNECHVIELWIYVFKLFLLFSVSRIYFKSGGQQTVRLFGLNLSFGKEVLLFGNFFYVYAKF